MDIKKMLLAGTCVATFAVVGACSDDSSTGPENPSSSSAAQDPSATSSGDSSLDPASSADPSNPTSSATSSASVLVSSSSLSDNDDPQMACSEIMYNAADGSNVEWVEIYIEGGSNMDNMQLYELHLSGAVDYTFPAEPLTKGEYVVVANDTVAFKAAYPAFAGRVFGPFTGKLANEGDVVNVKVRGEGDVSCAFSSEPPWPSLADGKGRSLVYTGGIAVQSNSWCASAAVGGNPGVGGDACVNVVNSVRINEIKPFASDADHSWMELYNSGDAPVDVSGWTVNVKRRNQTIAIKSGTVPPKGYLVLDGVDDFEEELIVSNQGGEIYLRGLVDGQESSIWVPASLGTSGVVDLADGSTAQGPLASATKGEANASLQLGSVLINEIHYHPSDKGVNFEFMELVNLTGTPITLYSATVGRGWKVEGIGLEFSATDILPANGMMLLVSDTLAAELDLLRSMYGVPESVPIKTYSGKLSNRGETVAVKEPFAKEGSGMDAKYFYIWHDATLYSDAWNGLTAADGAGYSLQRKAGATTMGYESSAWEAVEPTPGK